MRFGVFSILSVILISLLLYGCGSNSGASAPATPAAGTKAWTYMVYMGGDNNLSNDAIADLNEMEMVGSDANINIVVQAEFSPVYTPGVTANTLRFLVQKDNNINVVTSANTATSLGNVNMASPATLTSFIQWAKTAYPAQHYVLVLWDHGAGWKSINLDLNPLTKGAIQDQTSGTFMTLPQVAAGVKNAGVHFDIINFDACLMAMYEVAYEFSSTTNYLVFSEEVEPGSGDPYDTILGALAANPAMTSASMAANICNQYNAFYTANPRGATTKSAIDTAQVALLDTKVVTLANALYNSSPTSTPIVVAAQANTQKYSYPENHDLFSFAQYLSANLPAGAAKTAAADIVAFQPNIVIRNTFTGAAASGSQGLAIYVPTAAQLGANDLIQYSQVASNLNHPTGSWGQYINSLVTSGGGAAITYKPGGFGIRVDWTGSDADLDLYIWEPAANYASTAVLTSYAPWMGQTSPNGTFSGDSAVTGVSTESYFANNQVYAGDYVVEVNYYANGLASTSAIVHLFVIDPANGINTWTEVTAASGLVSISPGPVLMNLTNPLTAAGIPAVISPATLAGLNIYSNEWVPISTTRSTTPAPMSTVPNKQGQMILQYHKGSRLSWR